MFNHDNKIAEHIYYPYINLWPKYRKEKNGFTQCSIIDVGPTKTHFLQNITLFLNLSRTLNWNTRLLHDS